MWIGVYAYQNLPQLIIRNIRQFRAVVFWNHQLVSDPSASLSLPFPSSFSPHQLGGKKHTACPELNGLISRNARILSDSKSLKEGISPVVFMHPLISTSLNSIASEMGDWELGIGKGKYL
jgi:hypothetical protein